MALVFPGATSNVRGQTTELLLRVAVLNFGDSSVGRLASERLAANLKRAAGLSLLDRDQAGAAATGIGYAGSLNLSLSDARDLGAALGCDFFVSGDAQTLRRSPSTGHPYFESYASMFLVSARTGRLVNWWRPSFQAETAQAATQALLSHLSSEENNSRFIAAMRRTQQEERGERAIIEVSQTPIIAATPDDEKKSDHESLQLPRPFRRLIPTYTQSAADAEAEATIDVIADIDSKGDVTRVEVVRWGGFGLDESSMDTVKRIQFFPAQLNGAPIPIRVLLRYNFRKPPK